MRLALCGLAVSLAIVVLRSRVALIVGERLLSLWRSMPPLSRAVACSVLIIAADASSKTNGLLRLPSLPQMLRIAANPPGVSRSPVRFAARKAANWNVRGAWKDSFWLPFEDGWVFPHGTNHLSGVEVVSYGEVWATPFGDAVASLGVPVEIVPGLSSFAFEQAPSNSYRFVWNDAAINRDTNTLVTASIELFRNGDVCVTTNGVAAHLPRELPFEHHGYGQDDEWVAANFTNATEILAVGYPQWVDAQVETSRTDSTN